MKRPWNKQRLSDPHTHDPLSNAGVPWEDKNDSKNRLLINKLSSGLERRGIDAIAKQLIRKVENYSSSGGTPNRTPSLSSRCCRGGTDQAAAADSRERDQACGL